MGELFKLLKYTGVGTGTLLLVVLLVPGAVMVNAVDDCVDILTAGKLIVLATGCVVTFRFDWVVTLIADDTDTLAVVVTDTAGVLTLERVDVATVDEIILSAAETDLVIGPI